MYYTVNSNLCGNYGFSELGIFGEFSNQSENYIFMDIAEIIEIIVEIINNIINTFCNEDEQS